MAVLVTQCKRLNLLTREARRTRTAFDFGKFFSGALPPEQETDLSAFSKIEAAGGVSVIADLLSDFADDDVVVIGACSAIYHLSVFMHCHISKQGPGGTEASLRKPAIIRLLRSLIGRLPALGIQDFAEMAVKELESDF